ncbi:MAG: hypothetical protein F4Z75_09510, partial [Synechococcus sp. SB0668_bin_15]|nr:hypothetical protein [Synechococcus sp. SB0668_bin_15]MYC48961.1 hypothetical protein [Synechococcus sp. SB0662_bin_14]
MLLLLSVLGAAPDGAAQTRTLVKNTSQADATAASLSSSDLAQAFTTGTNRGGYILRSVNGPGSLSSQEVSVTIRRSSNGVPGRTVAILSWDNSVGGLTAYRGSGVRLASNTTYFFTLQVQTNEYNLRLSPSISVNTTASNSEDSGGAAGWSIADNSMAMSGGWGSGNSWASQTNKLEIDLRGELITYKPPVPPAPYVEKVSSGKKTMVSNLGQSDFGYIDLDNGRRHLAQGLRTGSDAGGYTLLSVDVEFGTSDASFPVTATIRSRNGSLPGDIIGTLKNPTFVTTGVDRVYTFTTKGIALKSNTNYFVAFSVPSDHDATDFRTTQQHAEDAGGLTGWSISNQRFFNTNFWNLTAFPLKIRINGISTSNPVVTPSHIYEGNPASAKCDINEGEKELWFEMKLNKAVQRSDQRLSVGYEVEKQDPEDNTKYHRVKGGAYQFGVGATEVNVRLPSEDDVHEADGVHTYRLKVLPLAKHLRGGPATVPGDPGSGFGKYTVGDPESVEITVCDNDPAPQSNSEPEGDG